MTIAAMKLKEEADYYLPQINYLKSLLEQNNIPFDLDTLPRSAP